MRGVSRHRPDRNDPSGRQNDLFAGFPRTLIEFESVARGVGLSSQKGGADDDTPPEDIPRGIVCGETNTSILPKTLLGAGDVPLPKVMVRGNDDVAALPAAVSIIPLPAGDELVVGGPEPADWVRLPVDARTAPTEPSLRRRTRRELTVSPDAPTPIESNAARRRERLRNAVALGIGASVALIGLSSLLVTSLVSGEDAALVAAPPVRAIEAAHTAMAPEDIPPPPQLNTESEQVAVVSVEQPPAQRTEIAPARGSADTGAKVEAGPSARSVAKHVAAQTIGPGAQPFRILGVQSGLTALARPNEPTRPQTEQWSATESSRSLESTWSRSHSTPSTQPKKRLWFPPE